MLQDRYYFTTFKSLSDGAIDGKNKFFHFLHK